MSGLIEKYRDCLPLPDDATAISLCEGSTPLIQLHHIPDLFDMEFELYVKYEGLNPTGSFKDRGMTVAVSQAVAEKQNAVICASTGNTSASAAAYAARSGMRCFVLIPEGKIAAGKLAQAMIEGAVVIQIKGNFDQGMELVKQIAQQSAVAVVNSINPYRLQGQKTASLEIIEVLGDAPDYHCIPVGNAGNISAYWMGYSEATGQGSYCIEQARAVLEDNYKSASVIATRRPKMLGYQAAGAAPIIAGHKIDNPETVATAIRIGNPQSWEMAVNASQESDGWFAACSDDEILSAQRLLAEKEGIFCEPASAISLAGLIKDIAAKKIKARSRIVCTLTGHGLKDPDAAIHQCSRNAMQAVAPEFNLINDLINEL
ncbi:MAG: threonine synthase [Gammaproteobacteria bacterium]|nr:threonine synthase [Gammaproteobacteria bacterium]